MTVASRNDAAGSGIQGELRMPAATMGTRAQRTSNLIQEKAREVFLAKGYFGTSIEDIAEAADVSRASFYTYFPSKRDVLVSIGNETYEATTRMLDGIEAVAGSGADDAIGQIVGLYLDFLDDHGAIVEIWVQAGFQDEELRQAGMHAKLRSAKRLAHVFEKLGTIPRGEDPAKVALGLEVMMERYWYYWRVAGLKSSRTEAVGVLASVISGAIDT